MGRIYAASEDRVVPCRRFSGLVSWSSQLEHPLGVAENFSKSFRPREIYDFSSSCSRVGNWIITGQSSVLTRIWSIDSLQKSLILLLAHDHEAVWNSLHPLSLGPHVFSALGQPFLYFRTIGEPQHRPI